MKYRMVQLGEIANITKLAGFEFSKYIEYVEDGEIIALRALNLRNGTIDLTNIKKIYKSASEKLPRSKLYKGDILLTYTGNGYGDTGFVEEDDKYHLAPNICKITAKEVEPSFLFQYIRSDLFKQQMRGSIGGSSQPTIPMKTIRQLLIPLPEKSIQIQIGGFFRCLDRIIANNIETNNNLEQQAQAIFDKIFPYIAHGDRIIGEFITPKRGKNLLSKDAIPGDIPVIAGGLSPSTYHNISNTQEPVITISASGANAGFVNLWHVPVWSSDSSFIDYQMTSNVYFWYILLKERQKEIFDFQTGSAQPHIYPQHIAMMPITNLNNNEINNYTEQVTPLFKMIGNNLAENTRLQILRDTLLPKLMSGEIGMSEVNMK